MQIRGLHVGETHPAEFEELPITKGSTGHLITRVTPPETRILVIPVLVTGIQCAKTANVRASGTQGPGNEPRDDFVD